VQPLAYNFLDQLGARAFIFDKNCRRVEFHCLIPHGALQFGILHPSAQNVPQIEVLALRSPGRTDTVVAQLSGFYSRIPALESWSNFEGSSPTL